MRWDFHYIPFPTLPRTMTVEARLRVHHRGCLSERTHGAMTITQLGTEGQCTIFLVTGETREELDGFLKGFEERLSTYTLLSRSPQVAMVRGGCPPGGVEDCILSYGCSILFPSLFAEGREIHRILAPSRARLRQLLERLQDFGTAGSTLESVSDVGPESLQVSVNLAELASRLTRKQLDVLSSAVQAGYYSAPRRTSTERLASAFGVSRATLEEHLRKAEAKVLHGVMNVLGSHPFAASLTRPGAGRIPMRAKTAVGTHPP